MRLLVQAKGPDGVVLVSDALRAAGLPEGAYTVGDRPAFSMDGAIRLADGTLAGSGHHPRSRRSTTSRPPPAGRWPSCGRRPAATPPRPSASTTSRAAWSPGKDADLVLLDPALRVVVTVAEGSVVHGADHLVRPSTGFIGRTSPRREVGPCPAVDDTASPPPSPSRSPWSSGWPRAVSQRGRRPGQHRDRPRTLTIWLMDAGTPPAVIDAVNAEWKKARTPATPSRSSSTRWNNVTTKLDAAFAGSSPPDVVELGNTLVKYAAGLLQDLSGSRDQFENNQAWLQSLTESCTLDGKLMCAPYYAGKPSRHLPQVDVRQGRHHRAPGQPGRAAGGRQKLMSTFGDDELGLLLPRQVLVRGAPVRLGPRRRHRRPGGRPAARRPRPA